LAYLTVSEMKGYIRSEQGAVDDTLLTSILDAASSAIDDYCQRSFTAYASGGATARVFVPTDTVLLPIYDATTVTAITEDGTTLASTYWQAEPVNNRDGSGATVPFDRIRRIDGGTWGQTSGYPGKASISVTATWGWVSVPPRVKEACRIVAKEIAESRDARSGLVDFGDFAARATQSPTVARLLSALRGPGSWGMA